METSSVYIKILLYLPKQLSVFLSRWIQWQFNYMYNYLLHMKKDD